MKRSQETRADVVKIKFDVTNEAVILAAVITDENIRKKYLKLPADYFHGPSHAEMWAGIQELFARGLEYSVDTMRTIVGDKFDVDKLDDYVRVNPTPPANMKHHIQLLRWDKARFELAKGILPLLVDALRENTTEMERVISLAKQVGDAFKGNADLRFLRDGRTVAMEQDLELTKLRTGGQAIFRTGFDALDLYTEDHPEWGVEKDGTPQIKKGDPRLIPGVAPANISALTGLSGAGKTSWTANFIIKQAKRYKRRVLWAAWEQESGMSLRKAAAITLGFKLSDIEAGRFNVNEQREIHEEMERLGEYLIFFELPFGRTRGEKNERFNDRNLDLIHQYTAEAACAIAIYDVFNYALAERRPDEESAAIRRMRGISKDTQTHLMLVHHLNLKEVEGRQDKRPTRGVVMGTSGWINNLDLVLALHCPGMFGGKEDVMEVHLLKQRFGRWGHAVKHKWSGAYGIIEGGETIIVDEEEVKHATGFLDDGPQQRGGYRKRGG